MGKNESNAKYWTGVLYPENMRPNWEEELGDIVQIPFAYCIHDRTRDSKSEHRKTHVHIVLAFPNTTTRKHATNVFERLSAEGKSALNKIESVINIRFIYNYLIHDTDTCRKQGKEPYSPAERITGNNFDIGAFEQLGLQEKNDMCQELCMVIREHNFMTFGEFFDFVMDNYVIEDINYFEILKTYSGFFERLTKSNYQKYQLYKESQKEAEKGFLERFRDKR